MPGPCTGLTVLDFSLGMPGAICTLVMADYGADVIKVESPGGDPFRFQPAWISWNRGKKGIVLDLKTAEGREQAIQLAGEADVLVESFRPGDMAEWGLGYDTLAQLYPRLVYCSITGFGQKGPLRRVKGYEGVVAAKAGRMLNRRDSPTEMARSTRRCTPAAGMPARLRCAVSLAPSRCGTNAGVGNGSRPASSRAWPLPTTTMPVTVDW